MTFSRKISIITVCCNAEAHIEKTIQSIIAQTYSNYEHIIIDGGSTDGTVAIINKYIGHLGYFISEPDDGISDAMNKGILQATGEYILFLHADDYFLSGNSLLDACKEIDSRFDIVAFNIIFKTKNSSYMMKSRNISFFSNFKIGIRHQGALCKKSLFTKIGCFDTKLKINMDYDFFLRSYRTNATMKTSNTVLSVMRDGGISSRTDWPSLKIRFIEEQQVHKKNCNSLILKITYLAYWPLYFSYRRIIQLMQGIGRFYSG